MSRETRVGVAGFIIVFAFAALLVTNARGGLLNGNANAYNDLTGPGAGGAWTGSTPFDAGQPAGQPDLHGFVDWSVFTDTAFNSTFPGSGYTPTPGELVYTYQVFASGATGFDPAVTRFSVVLINPADHIGAFSSAGITGSAPSTMTLTANSSADWEFSSILPGASSEGLAFSSLERPILMFGSTVDHGTSATIIPLPTPGSVNIPEPATVGAIAMLAIICAGRRRI